MIKNKTLKTTLGAALVAFASLSAFTATGCAESTEEPRVELGEDVYAIMYEVYDDVGSNSYLSIFDSLDIEKIDTKKAIEFAGGRAHLQTYDGFIYVGEPASPEVVKYSLSKYGDLEEQGRVSFADYGFEAGYLDDWSVAFISPTKAYSFELKEGGIVIWNPQTMEIKGEIKAADELFREGWSMDGSPPVVRGDRLFKAYGWADFDSATYADDMLLGVYDLKKDELISLTKETRCSTFGNLVHRDEDDTLYFTNWIWTVAGVIMHDATPTCVLRINAGEDSFDPDYQLNYVDVAKGREGAMFSYLSNGQALFAAFYDERITFDDETDPWAYAGSQNWKIWSYDMKTEEAKPVEGLKFNAGAFTPVHLDERSFVMLPNSDWSSTKVHELSDGKGTFAFNIPGWSYQFKKVK